MVKNTPAMGWNSWNTYGTDISDALIRETADAIVENGLDRLGYEYVVIDDCWSLHERNENGELVADPAKFPYGMKALADYVHSKGLKFGMYSCCGTQTCAGYPGSYEHEFTDAATFASWGVDLLKYDFCFNSGITPPDILYRRMGLALLNCGRSILFSACSWGINETEKWIRTTGANMWRCTGDINDSWGSLKNLSLEQDRLHPYNCVGHFSDMDMLTVGMNGSGNVGCGGCTFEEYKFHFSLWSLLASPLMLGCDVRNMSDETKAIITNRELIAIDQDAASNQPFQVAKASIYNNDVIVRAYARLLSDGDIALGMFNMLDTAASIWINLDELAISRCCGREVIAHDLWSGEKTVLKNEHMGYTLEPHTCRMFRLSVKEKK